MIEAVHYPIIYQLKILKQHTIVEKSTNNGVFWHNATKYTSTGNDESFVDEVAYMMVTLHRTGA